MMSDNVHSIQALIFDLGGVLIDVREADTPRLWAEACGADSALVAEIYRTDTDYQRLERGQMTLPEYHALIAERIGCPISYEQFVHGWTNIFAGVIEGMEPLLASLAARLRVVALSNTNVVHTNTWRPLYPDLLSHFERVFVSHDMGARKPEPESYRQVIEYLGLPPDRVAFIDDRPENVRPAETLGLRGIVAVDAPQIAAEFRKLGLDV